MRIRYFGFLANARRQHQLAHIRRLLELPEDPEGPEQADDHSLLDGLTEEPARQCPACGKAAFRCYQLNLRPTLNQLLRMPSLVPS